MRLFWLVPLILFPLLLHAYVPGRAGGPDRPVTFRIDAANIRFEISDQVRGGLTNAEGRLLITADSDPLTAARNVIATLNGLQDVGFRFADLAVSPNEAVSGDGINSISFADTDVTRSIVNGALAVTRNRGFADGRVEEADIFFNPDMLFNPFMPDVGTDSLFATTGDPAANDVESTLLHEMIHALGGDHSSVLGATMFPAGRDGETFARTLTADDIAYLVDVYPGPQAAARFGRIQGTATFSTGGPIRGGMVTAVDPATGTVIGALTGQDGAFDFRVPPSSPGSAYVVYIEPLDGPVFPGDVDLMISQADTDFQVAFAPGAGLGGGVPVAAGQTVVVDIMAQPGPPVIDILRLGFLERATGVFSRFFGPVEVPDAPSAEMILFGAGLEFMQPGDFHVLNPRVTVRQNGIEVNPLNTLNGFPAVIVPLDFTGTGGVTQNLPDGTLGTIVITIGGATTAFTGALVLEELGAPEAKPEFGSNSLLGAASFGEAASGGLASLFVGISDFVAGTAVASAVPLSTQLAQTRVEFRPAGAAATKGQGAGIAAPLVFVSGPANQINLQIPWEIPPGIASVVVTASGAVSDAVNIAIAEFAPGIFSFDSGAGRAVAFFNDGTIIQPVGSFGLPARPAAVGEGFSVLATGMGPTAPPSVTGDNSSVGGTFVRRDTVALPTVTIGGVPAQVLASILSPEFVGVYQVGVIPQADTPAGDAVPIIIDIGGVASRADVTVAIAP